MPSLLGASRWTDAEQRECKRLEKARRLQVYGSGATVRQIVGVTNVAELHCNTLAAQVCPRRLLFRLLLFPSVNVACSWLPHPPTTPPNPTFPGCSV